MDYNQYPKGSEWRKWDLHFHTPSSFDYGDKSVTNQDIIDGLKKNNISVIAITDHNLIDIERIKELQTLGEKEGITVLPGIEFRCELGGSDSIHFIGIFSEDCNLEEIAMEIQVQCSLKPSDIVRIGHDKVYVDFKDTANLIQQLGGIVTIHSGSKTNTVENITNSLSYKMAQKAEIAHIVDIYELGKESDVEGYRKIVFPAINKNLPLIICSDNHNIRKYKPKQNLWIKADPTFLGLKQILCEPDDRVRICEEKPEKKYKSNIIEKVRFIDKSSTNLFSKEWVYLNQNLNTIIGGKSTGKSLLLYYIAKTIDFHLDTSTSYSIEELDFEVQWADGKVYKLGLEEFEDISKTFNKRRPITYISQLYINDLLEKDKERFIELIINFLRENEKFDAYYDDYRKNVRELTSDLGTALSNMISLRDEVSQINEEMTRLGDISAKRKEIELLKKQIKETKRLSKFSESDEKKLNELQTQQKQFKEKHKNLSERLHRFNRIKEYTSDQLDNAYDSIDQQIQEESLYLDKKEQDELEAFNKQLSDKFEDFSKQLKVNFTVISTLSKQKREVEQNLGAIEVALDKLLQKSDYQEKIKKLEAEKEKYQKEVNAILEKEKKLNIEKAKLDTQINILLEIYQKRHKEHVELANFINIDYSNIIEEDDIKLKANVGFHDENFYNQFVEKFNLKRMNWGANYSDFFTINAYNFDSEEHSNNIKKIALDLINNIDRFYFKKGNDFETAINALLDDYCKNVFQLFQRNDNIERMSPGKRGLVLLKLYLSLNKADYPILIDQPEDNLDNRTVYAQLKDFLKTKKIQRQIIMVTHNSNLVISTDAELVIVANQDGEDGKDNEKYKFEYVEGSLEFSKAQENTHQGVLTQIGIREHVCALLEGGKEAFQKREIKYGFKENHAIEHE